MSYKDGDLVTLVEDSKPVKDVYEVIDTTPGTAFYRPGLVKIRDVAYPRLTMWVGERHLVKKTVEAL